ncbi:MAG TPA: hypothetical protein VGR56_08795 [Nitrososphaerales archaeon]|nr:hypothetical protein [Nitrososphaerales archaeon]
MFGHKISTRRRILKASWVLIVNVLLWIVVPYYAGMYLAKLVPSSPITIPTFVYEFGIVLTILEVAAALTQGMALSVPFISAAALVSALYLWMITNGGNLAVSAQGTSIVLGFQLLVYLLIVPSLWAAVRAPLSYIVHRRNMQAEVPANPAPA